LYYFLKKFKILKNPKKKQKQKTFLVGFYVGFFWVFLGGFFGWVFLGGFFIAKPARKALVLHPPIYGFGDPASKI
jgi:hypothetical protein